MTEEEIALKQLAQEKNELCTLICPDYGKPVCEQCGVHDSCQVASCVDAVLKAGYRNQHDTIRQALAIILRLRQEEEEVLAQATGHFASEEYRCHHAGYIDALDDAFSQIEMAFNIYPTDEESQVVLDTHFGELFDIVRDGVLDARGPFIRLKYTILDKTGTTISVRDVASMKVQLCTDDLRPSYKQLTKFRKYIREETV